MPVAGPGASRRSVGRCPPACAPVGRAPRPTQGRASRLTPRALRVRHGSGVPAAGPGASRRSVGRCPLAPRRGALRLAFRRLVPGRRAQPWTNMARPQISGCHGCAPTSGRASLCALRFPLRSASRLAPRAPRVRHGSGVPVAGPGASRRSVGRRPHFNASTLQRFRIWWRTALIAQAIPKQAVQVSTIAAPEATLA